MIRSKLPILLVIVASLTVVWLASVDARQASTRSQRHRWWQSGEVKIALGLTEDQTAAIEEIYSSTQPVLRSLMAAFEAEQAALSELIVSMEVADWEFALQIDKVEAARSALSKERILMLYHMRRELNGAQQETLTELEEERRRRWRQRRSSDR